MLIEEDSEDMKMEPIDILKECENRLRDSEDKSQNVEDYKRILELSNINKSTRELGKQLIPHYLKFFRDLSTKAFEGLVNILTSEESLNPPSVSVEALISLLETAVPFFEIETSAPSGKFFGFLNTHFDKLPQDSKISLVKSLTKISLHTRDTKDMLRSIFPLLTISMNAADSVPEMDLTIVESLLYVFHHLADKNPDQGRILCSPDALSLFTTFAEITKTRMAGLTRLMTDLTQLIWQLESEEDSLTKMIDKTLERDDTKTQLRACNNILPMLHDVLNVPLSFIGDTNIINLSWKELRKPSPLRYERMAMDCIPPTRTHFEEKLKLDPGFKKKLDEDGIIVLQDQSEVKRFVGLNRLQKPASPLIPRGDIPQGLQPFVTTTSWKPICGYVRNQFSHILCSVYVATDMVNILRRIRNLETEYIPLCPWYVCSFCHPKKLGKDHAVDDPKRHDCYRFTMEEALDYIQQEGCPKEIGDTFNCKDHEPPSTDEPRMQRRKRGIKVKPIATLEEALKLLPTQPIGASLIVSEELYKGGTKTYYGPRTEYSTFQGYHAVLIVAVEEYKGEIVALCKMSNGTKVGDEGYVRVSLSTMYLVLGVDEEIQNLVQGNSEPAHLLSQFFALELDENEDEKDDEKEDKKTQRNAGRETRRQTVSSCIQKIWFHACLTLFLKMMWVLRDKGSVFEFECDGVTRRSLFWCLKIEESNFVVLPVHVFVGILGS